MRQQRALPQPVHAATDARERPPVVPKAAARDGLTNRSKQLERLRSLQTIANERVVRDRSAPSQVAPISEETSPTEAASASVIQPLWTSAAFKQRVEAVSDPGRGWRQRLYEMVGGKQVYSDNPRFKTVISLLDSYHEAADEVGDDARKDRMSFLHELQQETHDWYAENKAVQGAAAVTKSPFHAVMIDLMNDIEAERTEVVKDTVANNGEIWVPGLEDMEDDEQARVQNLWTSLTQSRGELQVNPAASAGERATVHARYLQLMSGPAGRQLLAQANRGNTADGRRRPIVIDPRAGGEPAAEPTSARRSQRRLPNGSVAVAPTTHTLTRPQVDATQAGPGSGSRIPFRDAPAVGAYYALGDDWNAATDTGSVELMPSFVVLGHELGHAVRQQRGQSTVAMTDPSHATPANSAWHNHEEQSVITGPENRIRAEHNLGKRKFHRAVPI